MKVFLSAIEGATSSKSLGTTELARYIVGKGVEMKYNLMSYYYIRKKKELAKFVRDNSKK